MSRPHIHAASPLAFRQLAQALGNYGCVILPTETVYGLAARADDPAACARIYGIKGRDFDKPLPVCLVDSAQAADIAHISPLAQKLMEGFWPGPLTLILPLKTGAPLCPQVSRAGTIALRVPDAPWAQTLHDMGWSEPLALTSANASGTPSPVTAEQAASSIGENIDFILDGGPCKQGQESTIIDLCDDGPIIVREGALPRAAFDAFHMDWMDI